MRKIFIIILSVLILNTFGLADDGTSDEFQAKYYDNAKVLRIKHTEGETFVKRSFEEGFEEASNNLTVFEKDVVGTTEGRIEVYLGRLNYLRLDYDTEVEFDRIPELRKTSLVLKVAKGGIYLDIENLDFEKDVEIQTPDCGVFLLDKGVYRINVNEKGETEVFVFEGVAEVSGTNYSRNVRENQKIVMLNGDVKERPFYFYTSETDGFDAWNKERDNVVGYARYSTPRYLESGYEDYEYELSRQGRWVYNNSYREYIWIPYNVGTDWSPYYYGRWVWSPFYGYVWTSYDSWGYFTHHYGRWHWDLYYGWYWYPGYHWSPGWVYWFWDSGHYGWCPISRWNRPVIVINKHWMRDYNYRNGIPVHSKGTVIIKKGSLGAAHINKVAINKGTLANRNFKGTGFGISPKDRTSIQKVSVINARGNTVMYKKSGFIRSKNYQTVNSSSGMSTLKKGTAYKYTGTPDTSKKVFKYSKGTSGEPSRGTAGSGNKYKYKSSSSSSSSRVVTGSSRSTYKSTSKSSSSSNRSTPAKKYKSSGSSSKSSGKSSKSSGKSSSSSSSKSVKKKKDSPSYSSSYRPSTYNYSSSGSSQNSSPASSHKSSYSSSRGSYYSSSTASEKKPTTSYKSSSRSSSSYGSYSSPSYKSSSRSSSSSYKSPYKSYSSPSSSYSSSSRSSYKSPSSSSRSYSSPKSSSSSYSSPSRSYKSSGSSSRSSSSSRSHSSSSKSSSSSSSKSSKHK